MNYIERIFIELAERDYLVLIFLRKSGMLHRFCLWFKLCTSSNPLISKFANLMRWRMVRRHHLQISRNTKIGPGFFIAHAMIRK